MAEAQEMADSEGDDGFPSCTFTDVCNYLQDTDSEETDTDDVGGASGLVVGSSLGIAVFTGAAAAVVGFVVPDRLNLAYR